MIKSILFLTGLYFLLSESKAQTVTDVDGNVYNTITIGAQIWMQENLKTTRFNNGDSIGTTNLSINNDPGSIYQWSYNYDTNNINIYGRLYTWYAVSESRNVCPIAWHVPSDSEWTVLSDFLGGELVAGGKMKEVGINHWISTDSTVNNSSGFTGLGGGFGNSIGFLHLGDQAFFWSSTQFGNDLIFRRGIFYYLAAANSYLAQAVSLGSNGGSVRCIKDLPANTGNIFPEEKTRVFPNPANDKIYICFEGNDDVDACFYDIAGKQIFQTHLTNKVNIVNLDILPMGVFVIKIVGANYNITRRLIKE